MMRSVTVFLFIVTLVHLTSATSEYESSAQYAIKLFKAYVCSGGSGWLDDLNEIEGMEEKTVHIRWLAADICERRDHTLKDFIGIFISFYNKARNVNIKKQKCILDAFKMYNRIMFCDIKGANYILEFIEKAAVDDRLARVCDMARKNAESNVGKSALCGTQNQVKTKRQFDTDSLISMLNTLICKKRMYSSLVREMERETEREISPFAQAFIESFCCILTK
uniref:Putative secretory peptide-68 n=1 Tax=Pleurobrachia bachei TaxID=34499 RepID=M4H1S3_PLEBA|nr:putative secretory peptide-68 [Pleurobrachia bachei]|eukprot:sb/3469770/